MEYTDPDPSLVSRANAPAATPSTATRGGDAATQIGAINGKLAGVTDGATPERLGGDAVAIRQRVSALADAATRAPVIRAEIARAFATFKATAPTPEQMAAAEKEYADASAALTAANAAADAPGATQADQTAANDAGKAAADAKKALADLVAQRKAARDALFETLRAIAKKVREIKASGDRDHEGGSGNGFVIPGQSAPGNGNGGSTAAAPGKGNGGTGSTPAPAAQAPGATGPTGTSPVTKTSSTTTDPSALLSALSQQAQQPQTQPAPAQPPAAAQLPQQAQQPQQQVKQDGKDAKHSLATDGILGVDDIARAIGETTGPMLTTAYAPGVSSPVPQYSTQYRPAGTPITGTTTGGAPVQAPLSPTTGTSTTGLHTASDVSGRSEPPRTATDPAPGTKLSGADPVNQTGTRPGVGTGTPMGGMPPVMGAPLGAGAPSQARGKNGEERNLVAAYRDEQMFYFHGDDTISEATPGGTIAQNRPSRDDDPRRRAA